MSDMVRAPVGHNLPQLVERTHELVDELGCTPEEVATILELPVEQVLLRLVKPCACGQSGCYAMRRAAEDVSRFKARKTSGRRDCMERLQLLSVDDAALERRILEVMPGIGYRAAAKAIGAPAYTVRRLARKLGVLNEIRRLTSAQVSAMVELRAAGMTMGDVARRLGIGIASVQRYEQMLGTKPVRPKKPKVQAKRPRPVKLPDPEPREAPRDPLLDTLVRRMPPIASVAAALLRDEDAAWRARRARP